jgi:hypothetical protein
MPCVEGALRAGDELHQRIADPGVRCYYVWLPVLPGDSAEGASWNEISMKRRGVRHYWDPELAFSRHMASALRLKAEPPGIAWDMYLLYPRGDVALETPEFWMHQLDTEQGPRLDVAVLETRVREFISGGGPT